MSIVCCITVKIQFDNISTYEYSSYSPSARSLFSIAHLGPLYSEILDPPLPITAGSRFLGYRAPLIPGSMFLLYRVPLVPGVPRTTDSWFNVPAVPSTIVSWFLG